MPRPRKSEYLVRRTTTRNGTRKMRKSVSEFGRFQISLRTSSMGAEVGTGVGLTVTVTAGVPSVDCTDMSGGFSVSRHLGISIGALTFLRLLSRISVPLPGVGQWRNGSSGG